jgi:hypothetical protein
MEEKERAALMLMLSIVLLRRFYHYGIATMAQRFFAPERGPDCALWAAQSFGLHSW